MYGPSKQIRVRTFSEQAYAKAQGTGLGPLPARILAARVEAGLQDVASPSLSLIPHPMHLADAEAASQRLADAISNQECIGFLTDYDVDGITSHAIGIEVLTQLFQHPREKIKSYIGHRIQEGYGITTKLTDRILADELPGVIVTADCGSSDEKNIARLAAAGIDVIVSDHHGISLDGTPKSAVAVVNPNRSDCGYPDKSIAGCMVTWLLLSQLRQTLIQRQLLPADSNKLSGWLDLVALGTVADAVSLAQPVNRAVVQVGLKRMNLKLRPCWQVMAQHLNKTHFDIEDLGFQIGPRINARGRIADPFAALEFLSATSHKEAAAKLAVLDSDNQDRRAIEKDMVAAGEKLLDQSKRYSHVVFHDSFHPGVQGIVASRLLDRWGKPTVVFSPGREADTVTGSARSIPEVHVLNILKTIHQQDDSMFLAFGGHTGAAGMTLRKSKLEVFSSAFETEVSNCLEAPPIPQVWTDGELKVDQLTADTIAELNKLQPFGRGFEAPTFAGLFLVQSLRVVGADGRHLQLWLDLDGQVFKGIWFNAMQPDNPEVPIKEAELLQCAYRLDLNRFNGQEQLQIVVEYGAKAQ